MKTDLRGKTALVTGSTSGIGLGIALALAQDGANIVLNGFGAVETALEQLRLTGAEAFHHPADVADAAQIEGMMKAAEDRFGRVDVLVNNAGIQHVDPIERFPVERWNAVMAINLSSAFHTIRLAIPAMRAAGWGRIINVASAHGLVASANKAAYVASKHGLVGLTKVVGLETATSGITCNAICPGWVLTPLVQKQVDAMAMAQALDNDSATRRLLGEKQPTQRFTTPEELGDLAVFLCSRAGGNVTGAAWNMDGGWCAQ